MAPNHLTRIHFKGKKAQEAGDCKRNFGECCFAVRGFSLVSVSLPEHRKRERQSLARAESLKEERQAGEQTEGLPWPPPSQAWQRPTALKGSRGPTGRRASPGMGAQLRSERATCWAELTSAAGGGCRDKRHVGPEGLGESDRAVIAQLKETEGVTYGEFNRGPKTPTKALQERNSIRRLQNLPSAKSSGVVIHACLYTESASAASQRCRGGGQERLPDSFPPFLSSHKSGKQRRNPHAAGAPTQLAPGESQRGGRAGCLRPVHCCRAQLGLTRGPFIP